MLTEEFFSLTYFGVNDGCNGFWSGGFFGSEEREGVVGTVLKALFCEDASEVECRCIMVILCNVGGLAAEETG